MWDDVASKSVLAVDFILVVKLWASQFAYGGRLDEACASLQTNGHSNTSLTSVERSERREESDNLLKCGSDFMLAQRQVQHANSMCTTLGDGDGRFQDIPMQCNQGSCALSP